MKLAFLLVKLALLLSLAAPAAASPLKPWDGATPPLALPDLEGKAHRLADYRGKVVLINFWATWCAPCLKEMPSIEALRASLDGRRFAVLAVNMAEPETRIRRFLEPMKLGFPVLLDRDASTAKTWQARVLPATYVLGPDGRIRYRHLGEIDWAAPEVRAAMLALMK